MPRDYRMERDAIIERWYGGNSRPRNPRPSRSWAKAPISPGDCLGIPMQVNSPYMPLGHCMVWRYALNSEGYGTLTIDGKRELAHRVVYKQTRGRMPEHRQMNHLCDRPYCVQPSHLYAGTAQDNRDDSQIFRNEELANAPIVLNWPEAGDKDDALLNRLVESDRYDGTEPWEPVEHPAQRPLEEFTCPRHDFAIPMFGGVSKICRICELSELDEKTMDEIGAPLLIAEICPVSQTIGPIFQKTVRSEFVAESNRAMRRTAYRRSVHGYGVDSHFLRSCRCDYCARDRIVLRDAIQPLLTREESDLLDFCDRLQPKITTALEDASAETMGAYAMTMGLSAEQARILRTHHGACANTRVELNDTSRCLEGELGYLLHAIGNFYTREDMLGDEMFRQLNLRWSLFRLRKEDEEQVRRIILPVATSAACNLIRAWEHEGDQLTRSYLGTKPDLCRDIKRMARTAATKRILEHLRYELLGRNSYVEQEPHPHAGCAANIVETGRVEPFSAPFEEGMGYRSGER